MKKPFYLIQALILCYSGTLCAQQSSRLIARSSYNVQAGVYNITDSSKYTYSFGRGGHADTTVLFDRQINYVPGTNGIRNNYQYKMLYNHKGEVTEYETQTWNVASNAWQNMIRVRYNLNDVGITLSDTVWNWDNPNSNWKMAQVTVSETNVAGKITTRHFLVWNEPNQKFDTSSRYTNTYDGQGNLTQEIIMQNVSGVITNNSKRNYTYNSSSIRTNLTYYIWNAPGNKWVEQSQSQSIIVNNRVVQDISLVWNTATSKWDSSFRNTYTYNSAGKNTKNVIELYTVATSTWMNSSEYLHTYNSFGHKTKTDMNSWNTVDKKWVLNMLQNYYYETYNPSTVANIGTQNSKLNLWPVPGNDVLNINISWDKNQPYTAVITDIAGRLHKQLNKTASSNTTEQINISALPAGTYNVSVHCENGSVHTSMFTVVR